MRLGSIGEFGWSGWLGTICQIDPLERLVALCYVQHLPLTEHRLSQLFMNLVYQALAVMGLCFPESIVLVLVVALVLERPGHAWRILAHPVLVRIKVLDQFREHGHKGANHRI